MAVNLDMSDFKRLVRTLDKIGGLPQKCVTKAARKGGSLVIKAVRQKAPVDTGTLKRGLRLKAEKSRTKGKKVYDVAFDAGMNDVFKTDPEPRGGWRKEQDSLLPGVYGIRVFC